MTPKTEKKLIEALEGILNQLKYQNAILRAIQNNGMTVENTINVEKPETPLPDSLNSADIAKSAVDISKAAIDALDAVMNLDLGD